MHDAFFISRRKLLAGGALAPAAALLGGPARAADFPTRTITVISPFPPGGLNDTSARAVARALQAELGKNAIVENRPGGGTMIALEHLSRQAPDGHTLLICGDTNMAVMPHLQPNLSFSLEKDFAPITLLVSAPAVLVVRPSLAVKSVQDLVALAKAQPGKLSYASAGNATPPHMIAEQFKSRAGLAISHVPFKGASEGLTNVLGDHVDLMFVDLATASAQVKANKVRALAVSTAKRSKLLPDVPTIAESGLPGFEGRAWQGVITRQGTPADVILVLNRAIVAGMQRPEIGGVYDSQGAELVTSTPEQFAAMIADERAKAGRLIQQAGIKLG
ncbi:tripartite tricarboxylate transporter substrate binding protein [Ramlibacter sp. PS3R-8]|uniref:Bug family tripartite tricarboxylate transporter substrate binding protein n=1 Tax=Ramlibacter sp. PS3R-8 TaxID=3133437 RepID=UPI0030A6463A